MWNNRRVNSIIGSLYDDNKQFTEPILISEEKTNGWGACFNVYLLLKSIDIELTRYISERAIEMTKFS